MKNVEDIYTLSSMQQALLVHTLTDSGAGVQRVSWSLHGQLNVDAYRAAWELVVERHTILRTAFVHENVVEPLQIVRQRVMLPWIQHDWRSLPRSEQQSRLTCLLEAEQRGFDLSDAPLMRLTLIQLDPEGFHFIWSYHHLLLDRSSVSLILKEVRDRYSALSQAEQFLSAEIRPFRDYIAWLQQQDIKGAEKYWRETLSGFSPPSFDSFPGNETSRQKCCDVRQIYLSTEVTAMLQATACQNQWTLNTLIQGAWGLLLGRYGGEHDVVFGTLVSGRPAELPGSETMVGLFINTLPLRVQLQPGERVRDWLVRLQARQGEIRRYDYSPLIQVQQWSEVTRGRSLFESIVVFENLPVDNSLQQPMSTIEVRNLVHHEMASGYPLTVAVAPGQQLRIQINYDSGRFDEATIARMFGHLEQILAAIAGNVEQHVAALLMLTAEEQHTLEKWKKTAPIFPAEAETVKVRGFRIDVGEVEAQLQQHPGVKHAVVVARPDEAGEQRLVAYLVKELGETYSASGLRLHLQKCLPEYMIPSAFVALESVPLTAQGKVDRQALPGPNGSAVEAYLERRKGMEEVVCGIWSEVLKLERVGVEENFFEIGGNSLLATQIMARVREVCEVEVSPGAIFDHPTVRRLSAMILLRPIPQDGSPACRC